ncbi:hypothetical protein [Synechococcus sp. FACHB-909]|uniref:hypothetical protein n=1 Tax=Synechococcus sp. FACHB-909 TaxID=2692863 RepID=UPI00168643D0|nr:hypothetical protein [Synechococcus sp. FACHB-909]MBD2719317.1 hypothetical protein [Synechococcus sp. FACHB-909]
MPLVSTFEVLLTPQLPATLPPGFNDVKNLGRNVLQGYFLTIANINPYDLVLSLVFTTRLPSGVTLDEVITFVDTSGLNTAAPLSGVGNKYRFSPLFLPADATALFILQPSPTDAALAALDIEARGFVDLQLSSLAGMPPAGTKVLVTAEQRGTFFDNTTAPNIADRALDQIAYGLTVQNGGLLTLN